MYSPFGFSIQSFFVCLFYCQKTAFVCEFQHSMLNLKYNPLVKLLFFLNVLHLLLV
jgi:hypothetical protein